MKIHELMTTEVKSCHPGQTLAEAAGILWEQDCGVVPVTDEQGRVVGMLTDRDICMAVATQNRLASEILISEIVNGKVQGCAPDDEVDVALQMMKQHRIRRIPICDENKRLCGILSVNDIILSARKSPGEKSGVPYESTIDVLKAVSEHRHGEMTAGKPRGRSRQSAVTR